MSSSVHIDKKNYILILGIGPTQGLDDPILTAEAQYSKNLLRSNETFCSRLHGNGSNSFLFVNASKKYRFKGKKSEKRCIPRFCVIIMSHMSFRVNPHSIVCLNVKEVLARSRRHI